MIHPEGGHTLKLQARRDWARRACLLQRTQFFLLRSAQRAIVARFMSVTELAYAPTHRARECTEPAPRIQQHSKLHQSLFPSTRSRLRIQRRTKKYFFNNQMMRIAEDCSLNSECYRR